MKLLITLFLATSWFFDNARLQKESTLLDSLNHFGREFIGTFFTKTGRELTKQSPETFWKPFPCKGPHRSKERPSSVHKLRPGDIDVIAAMGDSITSANGAAANQIFHIAVENRGLSWSAGGQGTWRQFPTLPNILKEFNPNLVGYSTGDSASIYRDSQFNVADGGALARDMPYMAKVLVKRIKADKRVNFTHDWKLVTLMIGANDLCSDVCYYPEPTQTAELSRRSLIKTFDYLQQNLPRTMVNLVPPPNIEVLLGFKNEPLLCKILHMIQCSCIFGKANDRRRKMIIKVVRRWQEVFEDVVISEYHPK